MRAFRRVFVSDHAATFVWRLVAVLGLWLCCTGAAGAAGTAEYRFPVFFDVDQSAATGCDTDGPAGTAHGQELRTYAETDRAQILRVVTERCESGAWVEVISDASARSLGLGQGSLGSDVIEWEIPRTVLGDTRIADVQLLGRNVLSGAFDVAGPDGQSVRLRVANAPSVSAAPSFGTFAAVLLVGALVLLARRHRVAREVLPLLVLGFAASAIAPTRDSQAARGALLEIADPANDSVGHDAGVDFVRASIRESGAVLAIRLEVNNIEADGLPDHARVLIVGNSLSFFLSGMLTAIAAQAGKTVVTGEVVAGGFSLGDHLNAGRVQGEIATGYQLVIMQQGPSAEEQSQANLLKVSARYATLIRSAGGRPALYMVWPELARFNRFDDVHSSYSNAALAIDGMFIPGGEAWRESWQIDPALPLYGSDNFHPSTLGAYAIAVSVFSEIYRQTPVDLPTTFSLPTGQQITLDPAQARAVQQGAWQAHLKFGRAGK
jgi:hypothetical protein